MNTVALDIIALLSLFGMFFISSVSTAIRRLHPEANLGHRFFYRPFHLFFFPTHENEGIYFISVCALTLTRYCFSVTSFLLLYLSILGESWVGLIVGTLILIGVLFLFGDYLPRTLGKNAPKTVLKYFCPFASIYLLLVFPFAFPFLKISSAFSKNAYFGNFIEKPESEIEQEIIQLIRQADLKSLKSHEKKLIVSVLSFCNRIVREIMVPRVNVFSLSADTPIKDAAKILEEEGYSRVPVFKDTVDNIVGLLMHKDLVKKFAEYAMKGNDPSVLEAPISTIQKSPLYTPETKKISELLQEFRKKQVHLAIVVDEYGGTEGIVTIEDILEEIVGEIADEYDIEEELFLALPDGSWIVDARMSIIDVEDQLKIKIPQTGEYDTIGGYIFHRTGTIPLKGFVIHHDEFEMEILRSNDRCVEKVRIRPIHPLK